MKCPFDDSALQVVNRQGVEIDWCPSCKGVWLERGELEKLIDHAASATSVPAAPIPAYNGQERNQDGSRDEGRRDHRTRGDDRRRYDDDDDDGDRYHSKRGRRRGFLSEIFDFD